MAKIIQDIDEKKDFRSFLRYLKKYTIGSLGGMAATLIFLCISAFILTIERVPDSLMSFFSYAGVSIGAFVAGFLATKLIRTKGFFHGVITGFVFFVLQFVLSLAFGDGKIFSLHTLIYLVLNCLFAALGGITGVNFRK